MEAITHTRPNTDFLKKTSANNITWSLTQPDERLALTLSQRHHLPEVVARIMANRNIEIEQSNQFLAPSLKESLPDPFHLLDMDKAVERLITAINNKESITVFGDYDVDGATSTALIINYFHSLGITVNYYIPDRIEEGYGPNTAALLKLKEQETDLLITVDCGAVSFEPLEAAHQAGLDVIVIDHHLGADTLPKAVAVVNPNRIDETTPHRNLAAVGVTYLLLIALNSVLRKEGYFETTPEPKLLHLLDIVALGTVCDVMTLTGLNRSFVSQGLKIMSQRHNTGLKALSDIADINTPPSSYHLGFVLGPRINAGGRVGKSDLGTRLLTTKNPTEAITISTELNRLNHERKTIETHVQEEAIAQIEEQDALDSVIIVANEGWHPGVIGIVASRLKEKYNRPTAVIALENGIGKASARSVSGVDFGATVANAKNEGLLIAGGGHAMAAGFTIAKENIPAFKNYLEDRFQKNVTSYIENQTLKLDGILTPPAITPELAYQLERLAPYGMGNPTPKFAITGGFLINADIVGTNHIRCLIGTDMSQQKALKAMAFRATDTPLGQMLLHSIGRPLTLAGQIRLNHWQGKTSAEFTIEDAIV